MLLTDFVIEQPLLVEATIRTTSKKVNFKTTIKDSIFSFGTILVEPIMLMDQMVNFSLCDCNIFIFRENKKPIIFRNVKIEKIEIDDKKYHKIYCPSEGEKFNRRKEFRCDIYKDCEIIIGNNKLKGTLNNISNSGFCVSIKKSILKNKTIDSNKIKICFQDIISSERKNFEFSLNGNIIWKKDYDEKIVIGGELTKGNELIPNYIMVKQREELRKIKGKRK